MRRRACVAKAILCGCVYAFLTAANASASGPGSDVYRLVAINEVEAEDPGYFLPDGQACYGLDRADALGAYWSSDNPRRYCNHRYWKAGGQDLVLRAEVTLVVDDDEGDATAIFMFSGPGGPAGTAVQVEISHLPRHLDGIGQNLWNYWAIKPKESDLSEASLAGGELDLLEYRGLYESVVRPAATLAAGVPAALIPVLKTAVVSDSQLNGGNELASVVKFDAEFRFAEPLGGLLSPRVNKPPIVSQISAAVSGTQATLLPTSPSTPLGTDPDNDPLTPFIAWAPRYGSAEIYSSRVLYTPDYCESGTITDSFLAGVVDPSGHRACGEIVPTVVSANDCDLDGVPDGLDNCRWISNADQANNDASTGDILGNACDPFPNGEDHPPVAVADSFCVVRNTSKDLKVRENDFDTDHDRLSLIVVAPYGARQNGVLSQRVTNPNVPVFTPNTGYVGPASFRYHLLDPLANESNEVLVSMEVKASCP